MKQRSLFVGLALALASLPAHARIHSLTGNARYQIGGGTLNPGLVLPIGSTPAPAGRIVAVPGATVRQHGIQASSAPARLVMLPTQLSAPVSPVVVPLALANPGVFQLQTALAFHFPRSAIEFSAGGRTGAATVTYCAGSTVTPIGNPACNSPNPAFPGLIRYTRTSHQFGGPAAVGVYGTANIALPAVSPAPCAYAGGSNPFCQVAFAPITPPSRLGPGLPFGVTATASGAPLSPGLFFGTVTTAGLVVGLTPGGLAAGPPNPIQHFGGPWTTGRVTVSEPSAVPPQIFVLSGSDGRANGSGVGSLSLVSGGLSFSSLSGPNAERGWLNLNVGAAVSHVPLLPPRALAALVALLMLTSAAALRAHRGARSEAQP